MLKINHNNDPEELRFSLPSKKEFVLWVREFCRAIDSQPE